MRESVGLSTRSSDADLTAASTKAAELLRDVTTLKKVLATSGRIQLKEAAEARAQQTALLVSLADRLAPASAPAGAYDAPSAQFARAHAYLDVEMPKKLAEAYEKVRMARDCTAELQARSK